MARYALAAAIVACVVFAAGPAASRDGMRMAPMADMPSMFLPSMHGSCPTPEFFMENSEFLGLSAMQVTELKKLDFMLRKQQVLKGARVRVLELELTEIVTSPGFETDKALDKLGEIEKARTELRAEVIMASAKSRDMLDSGQKERLGELLTTMPVTGIKGHGSFSQPPKAVERDSVKEQMMREMMQRNMQ